MHSKHPLLANDNIWTERKRVRWTNEEKRLLALSEAELIIAGKITKMNQQLQKLHPGRTLDSVKSYRRSAGHQALVQRALARLRATIDEDCSLSDPMTAHASPAPLIGTDVATTMTAGDITRETKALPLVRSTQAATVAVRQLSAAANHGVT